MKVTTIVNGKICLILTPENTLETEILKKLNGASATVINTKTTVLQNSVEGGLLITVDPEDIVKNNKTEKQ